MNKTNQHSSGIITSITPQKKRKNRYSIFVDEEFLIGISDAALLKNNLQKGVEMTPSLFRKLQQDEGRQKVKSYLLKLLSMRSHARQELFTKAKRKDYSDEIINDILDEFESRGLIDDEAFACQFARDKSYLNHWGPAKIEAHLLKKGIPKEISGQAISDVFEEIDLKSCFTQLIEKRRWKFMREENLLRRKKKIADYLRRKGYYASDIYKHLDFLAEMLEE